MPEEISKIKSSSSKREGVVESGQPATQVHSTGLVNNEIVNNVNNQISVREVMFTQDKGYNLVIPVAINQGPTTNAIIDTAAQVTVINSKLARQVGLDLSGAEKVTLRGVGVNSELEAFLVKGVRLVIGRKVYRWDVYVAHITDEFILGLDFLLANKCQVDLQSNVLHFMDATIPAILYRNGDTYHAVRRVLVKKRVVIPPRSRAQVRVTVDNNTRERQEYVVSPVNIREGLVMPTALVEGLSQGALLMFINVANHYITLKPGKLIGCATEVEAIMEIEPQDSSGASTSMDANPELMSECSYGMRDSHLQTDSEDECSSITMSVSPSEVSVKSVKCSPPKQQGSGSKSEVPEHLQTLLERSIVHLNEEQSKELALLLTEYQDVFSKHELDIGCFTEVTHGIDTRDAKPIRHRLRRTPLGFQDEEGKHLQAMLDAKVIQPSSSDWAASPVLIRKKDSTVRWCIDYRDLNNVTVKDAYPLPLIEECLDTLGGSTFYSNLDMASSYWQVPIVPEDRHKTAFITKKGLFEFVRMPFGLCNAPATFMRAMNLVLNGLTWSEVLAFLDDVLILGKGGFEGHLHSMRKVFERFRKHRLKLKPKKCSLFQVQVKFLGRMVSQDGVAVDPEKVETVKKWPVPTNTKEVESFLGFVNYHREHIQGFAEIASCLYELTGPRSKFCWEEKHEEAFQELKSVLTTAPVLGYPQSEGTYILDCDASDTTIGAELSQMQEGRLTVIAYGSLSLSAAQRKYCTTRKELLAVVRFTRQYRHYLLGQKFVVRTDHSSLTWLMRFRHIEGQLARWLEELSQYDMDVVHRPGKKHENADGLSRIPDRLEFCECYTAGKTPEQLPCGGCKYCVRTHNQWSRFEDDVDDVIPLAVRAVGLVSSVASGSNVQDDGEVTNWFGGYSYKELREHQLKDQGIGPVMRWLESDEVPTTDVLLLQSPSVKHLWLCRSQLSLEKGVLYYRWEDVVPRRCFVVPKTLQDEVLKLCHDVRLAGHLGQTKTLQLLRRSFFWHKMSQEGKIYVESCAICSLNKKPKTWPKAGLGKYHAGAPLERVHIDILGPFASSTSGNIYVLMLVDQFTKWLECYPLPNQSADSIVRKVVDEFIARFGCPLEIHSDQGRNVDGNLINAICELLEITKTRTTPYRPRGNGQVERYNRLLLQMIRCCVQDANRNWDRYLPQLAAAIRAMPNRNTGFSANLMMLGREVVGPRDLLFHLFEEQSGREPPAYVRELRDALSRTHEIARQHLRVAQERQKRTYDLKLAERSYEEGDLVYKLEAACKPGQSRKLAKVWSGPHLITKKLSAVLYKIKGRRRECVAHHDRLKPCKDRFIPMWMRRMRHNVLDLDATIPYDQDEQEESFLADVFQELFGDTDVLDSVPGSGDSDGTDSQAGSDTQSRSDADTPDSQQDMGTSAPISLPAIDTQATDLSPQTTRRGRPIVPPAYLSSYQTHM